MFCVALVPPLWQLLMDSRLDALAHARSNSAVQATPSGFNAAVRVILDGWLFRGVQ
jgi:hypothetical protein